MMPLLETCSLLFIFFFFFCSLFTNRNVPTFNDSSGNFTYQHISESQKHCESDHVDQLFFFFSFLLITIVFKN